MTKEHEKLRETITMEKSKVNIRQSGNSTGYLIEITNAPIDQMYAVTRDELRQIVLIGHLMLKDK
jgi:hypothetical protein